MAISEFLRAFSATPRATTASPASSGTSITPVSVPSSFLAAAAAEQATLVTPLSTANLMTSSHITLGNSSATAFSGTTATTTRTHSLNGGKSN